MPSPGKNENSSTYFVYDRRNPKELTRLAIQDHLITGRMGGVLAEQADPTVFRRVLDIGCGTGGWVIEAAQTYPEMSLVGVDISQHMIKYARTQAHQVNDRVEFYVMDVLGMLDFPAASFDLVNLRFGISFLRTWDWPRMLSGLLWATCPDGVVRVTESEVIIQSNSPALTQLCEMVQYAFFRAGQTKTYAMEYRAGTAEGEAYCENLKLAFQMIRPFIQKWGNAAKDYEAIYRRALGEMCQPDFLATANMLTTWGRKP